MPKNELKLGRPYSRQRISAYECEVNQSGDPIRQGNYVAGWYGVFTPHRLQTEIMPKLSEHAAQGRLYPFLITSHQLADKAEVHFPEDKPRKSLRASDIKFSQRRRCSPQTWVATVLSPTRFKELGDIQGDNV